MTMKDDALEKKEAVKAVLRRFQEGYVKRNVEEIDTYLEALFVKDADALIVGTGSDEWCVGPEGVRDLIESDWKYWGDFRLDIDGAMISSLGDTAWLATRGTVTQTIQAEGCCQGHLGNIQKLIAEGEGSARNKLLEILRGASNTLFEIERGEKYVWPIRFTAVLVKRDERWLFHQMQFSFATTRFPDERVVQG